MNIWNRELGNSRILGDGAVGSIVKSYGAYENYCAVVTIIRTQVAEFSKITMNYNFSPF